MHVALAGEYASAAGYGVCFQTGLRLLTFLVNAVTLRFVTAETLGLVNVRLTLLYSTLLFVSREPLRKVVFSSSTSNEKTLRRSVNLSWCALVGFFAASSVLVPCWLFHLSSPTESVCDAPTYSLCVGIFALCALIEVLAEPHKVFLQLTNRIKVKMALESLAWIPRAFMVCVILLRYRTITVLGLSSSMLLCSLFNAVTTIVYAYHQASAHNNGFRFTPTRDSDGVLFDQSGVRLALAFFKQTAWKQLLTEGERYVMTLTGIVSLQAQGVYDVINNLGSLLPRLFFSPIEESYSTLFSRLLVRGKSINSNSKSAIEISWRCLTCTTRLIVSVGCVVMTFGMAYSQLLLQIIGGPQFSNGEAVLLLRTYSVYVLVLAANGIPEGFMFSTMSLDQVSSYNYSLAGFSVVFVASTLLLVRWLGPVGFIIASCLNMSCRIFASIAFIQRYYSEEGVSFLRVASPRKQFLAACSVSMLATVLWQTLLQGHDLAAAALHVTFGLACLAGVLSTILVFDRQLIQFLLQNFAKKNQ